MARSSMNRGFAAGGLGLAAALFIGANSFPAGPQMRPGISFPGRNAGGPVPDPLFSKRSHFRPCSKLDPVS